MLRPLISLIILPFLYQAPLLSAEPEIPPFEQARRLEQNGDDQQAFFKYLSIPHAEFAALRIARQKAALYLPLLAQHEKYIPRARRILIEGELLLALGKKDESLIKFRQAAALVAEKAGENWAQGVLPQDEYFVEPPQARGWYRSDGKEPFSAGPGSHKDNRLLRRFLALDAFEDAAREFARGASRHLRVIYIPKRAAENMPRPHPARRCFKTGFW